VTERYVILSGEGLVEVGDLPPQRVRAGDVVVIPARCRQRIANLATTDLVFLAICSPRLPRIAFSIWGKSRKAGNARRLRYFLLVDDGGGRCPPYILN